MITNLPNTESIKLELDNNWLTIWLNTPENRNALTDQMIDDFNNVFEVLNNTKDVRGVTIRGKNNIFCAGGDLKGMNKVFDSKNPNQDAVELSTKVGYFFKAVNSLPQVTIMIIEGVAMAGGLGLACAGDVTIVQSDTKFALTETMVGLTPAQISPYLVSKMGYSNARRLMLTAASFNGKEALRFGLADFIFDDENQRRDIEEQLKSQVLNCAPGAIAQTKELINSFAIKVDKNFIDLASKNFADQILNGEGREGISSFIEKRKPKWKK